MKSKDIQEKIIKVLKDFASGKFDYGARLKKDGELYMFTIESDTVKETNFKEVYKKLGLVFTEAHKMKQIECYKSLGKFLEER